MFIYKFIYFSTKARNCWLDINFHLLAPKCIFTLRTCILYNGLGNLFYTNPQLDCFDGKLCHLNYGSADYVDSLKRIEGSGRSSSI